MIIEKGFTTAIRVLSYENPWMDVTIITLSSDAEKAQLVAECVFDQFFECDGDEAYGDVLKRLLEKSGVNTYQLVFHDCNIDREEDPKYENLFESIRMLSDVIIIG